MALLELWEADDSDPTIAKMLEYLQTIERFDVIDDILPLLGKNYSSLAAAVILLMQKGEVGGKQWIHLWLIYLKNCIIERDSQSYLNREEARKRKMMPIQDASGEI